MTTEKPAKQGPNILGGLMDLLILVLLVCAAGGGGYYWGTVQRMAPVQGVPPGTPGALTASTASSDKPADKSSSTASSTSSSSTKGNDPDTGKGKATEKDPDKATEKDPDKATEKDPASASVKQSDPDETNSSSKKSGKKKYWITSSGMSYTGYSITVSVNGVPVDSFFGPGKTVDITDNVKSGENTILFDAKEMGDKYNKHKDDEKSALTLQVISGPFVSENFKKSDVLIAYKRSATESEDFKDTKHFTKD